MRRAYKNVAASLARFLVVTGMAVVRTDVGSEDDSGGRGESSLGSTSNAITLFSAMAEAPKADRSRPRDMTSCLGLVPQLKR